MPRGASHSGGGAQRRPSEVTDTNSDAVNEPSSVPVTVLKIAGSVLAPLTVLTALMYYFGLVHAYHFFGTFGVDYTVFGLTTQDYLTRSADGLFVPMTLAAGAALLLLWTYRLLSPRVDHARREAVSPAAVVVLTVLGGVLVVVAVRGIRDPMAYVDHPGLPGLALSFAVLSLMAAVRLMRWLGQRRRPEAHPPESFSFLAAEWSAAFVLVSAGLFWAAGDWSTAVGSGRGQDVLQALPRWPDVVVYTHERLHLQNLGVHEVRCRGTEATSVYRYDGLHLIFQAGDQYLLLPTDWDRSQRAIVIPKSDLVYLVFMPHGTSGAGAC
jgi:hypothetical protein